MGSTQGLCEPMEMVSLGSWLLGALGEQAQPQPPKLFSVSKSSSGAPGTTRSTPLCLAAERVARLHLVTARKWESVGGGEN